MPGEGKYETEVRRRMECGRIDGRQKNIKEVESEISGVLFNTSPPLRPGDSGADRETTIEVAGL